MTLLQIILLLGVLILLYMVIDAARGRRLRIFHVIVFSFGLFFVALSTLQPLFLNQLGQFVGVERGSDFLVYISIILLWISVFSLIQRSFHQQSEITRLTSAASIKDFKASQIWASDQRGENSRYLFLIRAYNEASIITKTLDEIREAGYHKIVVCNDGSSDNTKQVLESYSKQHPKDSLIVLSHLINRWPGAANKTLFEFARQYMKELWCERAVSYDADGQMDIADMKTFKKYCKTGQYDILFWSRFIKGGSVTNIPLLRRIILYGGRVITYIFNGLWLSDVSTGYRVYSLHALHKITLYSDRFSYQNDIIESVHRQKLKFAEIPVHIRYTAYSLQKGQNNLSSLKILVRLIYSSLFHR